MTLAALRFVVAIILIAHGLGHVLGILAAAGVRLSAGHAPDSWLLSGLVGGGPTRAVSVVFWLASLLAFVAAGFALEGWALTPDQWPRLGLAAAVLSLVTVVCFWHGLPFLFPNKVGALLVDVALLASVLWADWPARLAGP